MKNILYQIFKFGIVGGIAFIIDYLILFVLVQYVNMYYLAASIISFVVALIFNYICSMRFVFQRREEFSRRKEFIIFLLLSVIGLIINQIMMWISVEKLNIFYMISKIFATFVVMLWNFISRKIFLEK